MSSLFAPNDFKIPISFVLSITDVYIEFMIPILPTTTEIKPIDTKITFNNPSTDSIIESTCFAVII